MADTSTSPRRKIVSTSLGKDVPEFYIYSPDRDADGKQLVAETIYLDLDTTFGGEHGSRMLRVFATQGVAAVASNAYTHLDDPSVANVKEVFAKLFAMIADGSWSPGRSIEAGEPDDIAVAIAEATGQLVSDVQTRIDTELVKDENGANVLSKNGRTQRVFNRRLLDTIAKDPQVAPIMARLARERADRLAKDARAGKGGPTTGALDLFGGARPPTAVAAN